MSKVLKLGNGGVDLRHPKRRRMSAEYKLRILAEVEACAGKGQVAAILRREGRYWSHLLCWRKGEPGHTGSVLSTLSAIVLRTTPWQEGGLVVSFLTEHGERAVGLARGAKKPTAKWVSGFEPLSLVRVSFFGREQAEMRRVTRCELQHTPLTLGHLESSLVIACLADLFDRVAREGVEDDRLFRLLSSCAGALKAAPDRALAVLAYAEHWLLHCLGLLPHPRLCGRCGNEAAPLVLFTEERGWCCAACTPVDPAEALPPGTREHLRALRTLPAEEAPDPAGNPAACAVTDLLRERLLRELGQPRSYGVLERMLVGWDPQPGKNEAGAAR